MKTSDNDALGAVGAVPAVAIVLPASPAAVGEMRHAVARFLVSIDVPAATVHAAEVAVSEAVSNAVAHAYPGARLGRVIVHADLEGDALEVVVRDEGVGIQAGSRE